jgi:signal recognition particle subunit SEC65
MIESSANAKKIILGPFSNQSFALGNDALTRSLFSIAQKDSNGSEIIEISSRGKTPEAARLLSQLIYRAQAQMLEKESEQAPLLPVVAELTFSLQRKEKEIEELRRQIQQRQSAKPIGTVEEISLRAERDQCEKELAEHVDVFSTLKEARKKGASSENLATLAILSNKGNLSDFSSTIKQLREFRHSPKAKNKAIREELDHQIAQAMQKLGMELTRVITSLKEGYSETLKRRNEVRARLVTIAKATSSESKSNPRFQLLEKREQEVLILQNRYDFQMARWQDAKGLLVAVNGKKNGPD